MQIKRFLELSGEFVNTQIDSEEEIAENISSKTLWGGRI